MLERTLRSYSCLTVGDCFVVNYNNKDYEIEVRGFEVVVVELNWLVQAYVCVGVLSVGNWGYVCTLMYLALLCHRPSNAAAALSAPVFHSPMSSLPHPPQKPRCVR